MRMKLIIAMVADEKTDPVIEAARAAGATGATVITSARGEGLTPQKTFLGLDLSVQRDLILFLVPEQRARHILETIGRTAGVDEEEGAGIAFQIDIEDVVGLGSQLPTLKQEIEEEI